MANAPIRWVIFTDLDETLLDRERYAFDEARPALDEVRRRSIPLVLCTSKTAAETIHFRSLLGIGDPFVVEGGGGVYVPRGYFTALPRAVLDRGEHVLIPLAAGRDEALAGLAHLKEATANAVRGFSDMTDEDVARETGLPPPLAALARQREFDEPFTFVEREDAFASRLPWLAAARGLRVSRGGRFWHLHGETDKGLAVRFLASLFEAKLGPIRTIALGDSAIDLPMLAAADVAIAVPRAGGLHDPVLLAGIPRVHRAPAPGPAGWNAAVLAAISG
jgi:mannosyl-3-phosphoglycerate phosphatase